MASIIHQECINGFILNKQNTWTYTITDFEYSKLYKQMKKEQKEREVQQNLNMNNTAKNPAPNYAPNHKVHSLPQVPVKQYFIGTDSYGFNHYSTLNSSGILIYYYIDTSGLYHYYN